jgi:hypothetical protein
MSDPAPDSPLNCDAGNINLPVRAPVPPCLVMADMWRCAFCGTCRCRCQAFSTLASSAVTAGTVKALLTFAGNLLRGGDRRGYNSMARMYTIEHANKPYIPS